MSSKMIVLKSSDGETFEVEEAVALESETIKRMIEEDNRANTNITLPITSKILAKMIEYCERHVHAAAKSNADGASTMAVDEDLKAFDAEFVKDEPKTLYDILSAACNLRIKSLIDLTAQTLADTIADTSKGMTPMEFRKTFDFLTKDLQLLEEEEARSQIAYLSIDDKCNR